jgi:protein-S-isoprenylcysteine O-methyltransferase Ste14
MPRPRADAQLVQTGVYALVRHPLYGALILGSIGYGLLMASPPTLLLAALLAAFFSLKSRREEAWLLDHFEGYAAYMERTRRFFPWLY